MLVLVKHAAPEIDPAVPAADWSLSASGRAACERLADALAVHGVDRIITSVVR